jgi:hypothetical protein
MQIRETVKQRLNADGSHTAPVWMVGEEASNAQRSYALKCSGDQSGMYVARYPATTEAVS